MTRINRNKPKVSKTFFSDSGHSDPYFERQYSNLKDALNVETDSDLARKLGITQQSVQGAKRRRKIPSRWLRIIFDNYRIPSDIVMSIDWPIRYADIHGAYCFKHQWGNISADKIRRSIHKGNIPKSRDSLEVALLLIIKDVVSDFKISLDPMSLTYLELWSKQSIFDLRSKIIFAIQNLPPKASVGQNDETR